MENLAERVGALRWHILYPNTAGQAALREVRADWLRTAAPDGAVWTVEQSTTGALHCNIITPESITREARAADHWQQIIKGNVRDVGAYIGKQAQMPKLESYSGRLYGTAGQLWQILANQKSAPVVAAAAAQYAIDSHAMIDRAANLQFAKPAKKKIALVNDDWEPIKKPAELTKEQARAVAANWLPELLAQYVKN